MACFIVVTPFKIQAASEQILRPPIERTVAHNHSKTSLAYCTQYCNFFFEKNRKKWEFHTAESSLTTGLIAAAHMEWPGHWKKRLEK